MTSPALQVSELGCTRGERALFESIGFALDAGGILVVEGANGVGKTSLLRILAGLLAPCAGTVRWHGIDIRVAGPDFRGALSYLGHAAGVKLDLTVLENVEYARRLKRSNDTVTAAGAIERLGLAAARHSVVRFLSAGQRRRVALASLLAADTPLWLLDEPLTALDASGCAIVENMIATHLRCGGLAVVTTHVPLSTAADNRQRIVLNEP